MAMHLLIRVLAAAFLAQAPASDGGAHRPTRSDLSGEWAIPGPFGEREPGPGPLQRQDTCLNGVTFLRLVQKGNSIEGEVVEGYHRRGARPAFAIAESERTRGTSSNDAVILKGAIERRTFNTSPATVTSEPVEYHLTFNPKTGHLVGTRNGKPFWAAPLIHLGITERCGALPP